MAYRKVHGAQGGALHTEELQATGLDLDWDMDKEEDLRETRPSMDRVQLQCAERQRPAGRSDPDPDPDPDLIEPIQSSVSASPHGRFERLQEDPDYISHFTRAPGKGQRRQGCLRLRYFLAGAGLFVLGLVIGRFAHGPGRQAASQPADTWDLLEELLRGITADKIQALHRSFTSLPDDSEGAKARYLYRQWAGLGLSDVQLTNHSVLLSLPGTGPNTITDRSTHQCFLANGAACEQRGRSPAPDQWYSYVAYSAAGTLEAEVVDVQYGSKDDLMKICSTNNVTNQIALLKLGQAPLLYKLSLLSELGFGGALLYVDPCDVTADQSVLHQTFGVTLNSEGDPSTPGHPSIAGSSRLERGSLTSLLVQPISASLARRLLSLPPLVPDPSGPCTPLAPPSSSERKKITLRIGTRSVYKTVFNVVGYLRGRKNPDRYVLVGSRHDSGQGGGSSAIMTQLISTVTEQTKRGWAPDRTTVFCSWGGSALGNIGSYEWGEENRVVLESSAVAYVSLHSPVRGTESLRSTASPSLLQLTSDIQRRQLLSCIRGGHCPGPNVSSLQFPGDVSFFANQLAVPTVEFAFEQTKAEEKTSFLSEAQFPVESPQTLDPLFKFHETIAKLTAEAVLRLVNDPVLPFYPLDIALDVQSKLRGDSQTPASLLASASSLRDSAAFLQSESMRPANDPKERDPSHVRMLNDVLRDLEKSFVVPHAPPGVYRNLLYSLPGKTAKFSILRFPQEPLGPCPGTQASLAHNSVAEAALQNPVWNQELFQRPSSNYSLSLILDAVNSAEKLVRFGLALFENYPDNTK
ncbi:inactive N-acetylated-alpha-linked acidic dipeptidase-like protein 2 [Aplochiton taeniatus]